MLVRLTDHLTAGLVECLVGSTRSIYVGCYALRNESVKEFLEDYHRDKRHGEGTARSAEERNSATLVARAKS